VLLEEVVGDGDERGPHDGIHESVGSSREVAVIHPDVVGAEDVDCVAVGAIPVAEVRGIAADDGGGCGVKGRGCARRARSRAPRTESYVKPAPSEMWMSKPRPSIV